MLIIIYILGNIEFRNRWIADKKQKVEFYDFLQVRTESLRSEVIDQGKRDDEEVDQNQYNAIQEKPSTTVPFIDFLSAHTSAG